MFTEEWIDRHVNRTDLENAENRDMELRAIDQVNADAIAAFDSE